MCSFLYDIFGFVFSEHRLMPVVQKTLYYCREVRLLVWLRLWLVAYVQSVEEMSG